MNIYSVGKTNFNRRCMNKFKNNFFIIIWATIACNKLFQQQAWMKCNQISLVTTDFIIIMDQGALGRRGKISIFFFIFTIILNFSISIPEWVASSNLKCSWPVVVPAVVVTMPTMSCWRSTIGCCSMNDCKEIENTMWDVITQNRIISFDSHAKPHKMNGFFLN